MQVINLMVTAASCLSLSCSRPAPRVTDSSAVTSSSSTLGTQAAPTSTDTLAAKELVKAFYDWYTPLVMARLKNLKPNQNHLGPTWWVALREDHGLSDDLVKALRADSVLQADPVVEHESFSADPFLGTQEPCTPYRVGGLRSAGDAVLVTVTAICQANGNPSQPPTQLVIEVHSTPGGLKITNVYLGKQDLLRDLCGYTKRAPAAYRTFKCG
jgi:hypothetical protein